MKIIKLEQFKEAFNFELEQIPETNKIKFINNEIKEIEKSIEPRDFNKPYKRYRFANLNLKTNHVFKLSINMNYENNFINAFQDYNFKQKIESSEDLHIQHVISQACEFVKYYNWLIELKNKPNSEKEKSSLNLEQKLLALQFLGLELRDYSNNHSAKVLGQILNVGSENIRRNLSNLYAGKNNIRTKENFEKLSELFKNKTFDSISNHIKNEVKTLH